MLICEPIFSVRLPAARASTEIDQVPPLIGTQLAGEAWHNAIIAAVADPPKNVADLVREEMRLGQIRRAYRKLAGKGAVTPTFGSVADGAMLGVKRRTAS